jgi:Ca2+-binding EF-hand superfamily protein
MMRLKLMLTAAAFALMASPVLAEQAPPPPPAPPQGPGFFERADLNKDGVITIEEVKTARASMFDRADANKDGFVVRDEMRTLRPPRPPKKPGERGPQHEKRGLMAFSDANADGSVTRAEFDAATAKMAAEKQSKAQERAAEAFTRLDANKDGRIDATELAAKRSKMKDRPDRPPHRPMLDTNKDGKISKDEWMASPDPLFERADANKDGRLTREEAAAAARGGREGGHHRGFKNPFGRSW